jgi:tetratricopeptide (TPR) repeat protein
VPLLAALLASGCATSGPRRAEEPSDPLIAQHATAARAAYERGDLKQARSRYEQALVRARATENSAEIARTGCNLAACLLMQGDAAGARPLLREAEAEFVRAGLEPAPALLLAAKAERLAGSAGDARAIVEAVLRAAPAPALRAEAELILAEMACDAEDIAGARGNLARAREALGAAKQAPPAVEAVCAGVAGHIELLAEQPYAAAAQFDRQARYLQRSAQYRDMAAALETAGYAYYAASMDPEAADRFHRAARAMFAQGNALGALKTIQHALVVAEKANSDRTFQQCVDLLGAIKAATASPARP